MTDAQKKMNQYTRRVERRLNLPGKIKRRVMADFITSIEARRENEQTDAEIYAELGTPAKAAADLNEQMKAYAYRKSPWRYVCLAAAVLAGAWLVVNCLLPEVIALVIRGVSFTEAAGIGVIGGADGPTAIFVTTQPAALSVRIAAAAVVLAGSLLGFLRLGRCRPKN